jgi:UPF0271 protein
MVRHGRASGHVPVANIPSRGFSQMADALLDLNADLGEGFGAWRLTDDAALLDVVTSANVACGFHAGDPVGMRRVAARAAARGVAVGAHVAYRDLVGFGRRAMDVPPRELAADVLYQLGALEACCRAEGTRVRYVKPHGALYHRVITDPDQARAVLGGSGELAVLGWPGQLLGRAEEAGRRVYTEGFPDRGYGPDGRLVPRDQPGALLHEVDEITAHAVRLAPSVSSLCLHGDSPGAVDHAHAVRRALEADGWVLRGL